MLILSITLKVNNMNEDFELNNGKVLTKDEEIDLLLLSKNIIFQNKYRDFLRNIPYSRTDN